MRQIANGAVPGSSRGKILDAAEALFARRGFGGVGLRGLAREVGLSKSALFHHFPTKVDLYAAVLTRILGDLHDAVAQVRPGESGELAHLIRIIEALIDALAASSTRAPLLLRTLFESDLVGSDEIPEADAFLEQILDSMRRVMEAGVASGEIRPVEIPHALQSLIGMVVFHFASGEFGDDMLGKPVYSATQIRHFKEFVTSFIVNGLAARPHAALDQGDSLP